MYERIENIIACGGFYVTVGGCVRASQWTKRWHPDYFNDCIHCSLLYGFFLSINLGIVIADRIGYGMLLC